MKYLFIILISVVSQSIFAQGNDEFKTIFSGKEKGGYGSFSAGYTLIDTTHAFTYSARGGVVLGHSFSMGLGGTGFISEYKNDQRLNLKGSISGGYGGVFLELILIGKSPVHLSVPCLIGMGGVSYSTWINEGTDYQPVNQVEDFGTFLVVEPALELEFNLAKYVRAAGYFSYRYTSDLDLATTNSIGTTVRLVNPRALSSYCAGIIFKFGFF